MLLAIDIGNTNIVFGAGSQSDWERIWRIQTDPGKTADEYEVLFRSLFTSGKVCKNEVTNVIMSSVVPSLTRAFREMIRNFLSLEVILVGPEMYDKLPIKILNPYEIRN